MLACPKKIYLFALLLFCINMAFAGTVVVTSNADSGPGTLRDAIAQCAANGTITRDSIIFALPDTSLAGRTITLLSALPGLTSNMAINGVSQKGSGIGVSNARVLLFNTAATSNFAFLSLADCSNVGIYGMAMLSTTINNTVNGVIGISYLRCHNLQIGRPGAGNYIFGCTMGIYANTARYGNYVPADTSRGLTLQSNIIGLDMNGGLSNTYNGATVTMTYYSLYIISTSDLLIGGDSPAEGNTVIFGYTYPGYSFTGYNVDIETFTSTGNGTYKINNNKFGTKTDGTVSVADNASPVFINITGNRGDLGLQFNNNYLQGAIWLDGVSNYVTMQANKIFSLRINTIYDFAITLFNCTGGGMIGGDNPSQGNIIYNNYTNPVYYFQDNQFEGSIRYDGGSPVTIRNNTTLCNSYHSSTIVNTNGQIYAGLSSYVRIDSTGINFVKGVATPNSKVDVYLDDDCLACEGKQHLGFTIANADSTWQYKGSFNTAVVATSTSLANGATSQFSAPEIIDYFVRSKQPSCGKKNGYIRGLQISGGDNVKWHYLTQVNGVWNDSVIATTLNLDSVGPGLYIFDAWLGKACRSYFKQYTLYDFTPHIDTQAVSITNPSCGQFSGAISNITINTYQDIAIRWINDAGTVVSNQLNLTNVGAGRYKLIITDTIAACSDSAYWFTLTNKTGPTVNINAAKITAATCGQKNGCISNIQFSNITGAAAYLWYDSLGNLAGSGPALTNIPGGSYRLKFKDQSGCDTITTPFIKVPGQGSIVFNLAAMAITPSKCTPPTGSIQNILATNATTYQWTDTVTHAVVATTSNLYNVKQGYYRLTASSAAGCTDSTTAFFVPQVAPQQIGVTGVVNTLKGCYQPNGFLQVTQLNPSAAGFSFEWVNSNTGQVVDTGLTAANLPAGNYYFNATDSNGCQQQLLTTTIANTVNTPVSITGGVVTPAICNNQNGAITQVNVSGTPPIAYTWYTSNGQQAAQTINLVNAAPGSYYLVAGDALGCTDTSSVFVIPDTTATLTPPQYQAVTIVKGGTATLSLLNPQAGQYSLYANATAGSSPVQQNTTGVFTTTPLYADTTVYVMYTSGNCSSALVPVNIKVLETVDVVMPTAFTPNSDGNNDVFRIKYPQGIKAMHMVVFSRWGQKIFDTTNPLQGWDGNLNGINQPVGAYVWMIDYVDITGKSKKISGSVMLIR